MNFPTHVRTKAEALQLSAKLFPNHAVALARIQRDRPTDNYPSYWIEHRMHEDLRGLFTWLFDDRTRIYKRARWHLFYDLATRLLRLLKENHDAVDTYWRRKSADEKRERRLRSETMMGEGEGI